MEGSVRPGDPGSPEPLQLPQSEMGHHPLPRLSSGQTEGALGRGQCLLDRPTGPGGPLPGV